MIVRIFNENQYRLADELHDRLQELDARCVEAADAGGEGPFRDAVTALLDFVRAEGSPLADDELEASDVMLPPPDVTLEEARHGLTAEGWIPD